MNEYEKWMKHKDLKRVTYVLTDLVSNVLIEALLFLSDDFRLSRAHVLIFLNPLKVIGDYIMI